MNPVIVIPTFVSARRRKEGGSVLTTYDHATPISQPGELPRLLASLQKVRGAGQIIVLVVSEPSIENQAAEKVQSVVSRFPSLNTVVIGAPELALIQQRMEQLGLGKLQKEIGLSGYGAVRNLGLVMADVLGFDSVVFLDDDEVVDDADFLQKAMYGLGKLTKKGIPILAKTGFYFNSEGSYLSKSQDKWYNHFWQQGKAFNKWISKAMRGPRLSRSNHTCGGCLALHKEAFSVCRSILGSRAAKISITCLTCVCTVRTSGSTISGACATFLPKPRARARASVRISSDGSTNTGRWSTAARRSTFCR